MGRTVQSKDDVLELLYRNGDRLRTLGVRRIGLFGSFVRDEAGPGSDLDLLVEFEPGKKSFDSFMSLSFFLEELFGRRVEVVTREALSPYIGPRILAETEYARLVA